MKRIPGHTRILSGRTGVARLMEIPIAKGNRNFCLSVTLLTSLKLLIMELQSYGNGPVCLLKEDSHHTKPKQGKSGGRGGRGKEILHKGKHLSVVGKGY